MEVYGVHYVVEGSRFRSLQGVLTVARDKGYTGTAITLAKRIKAGAKTWAELVKPPAHSELRKAVKRRQAEEMREILAAYDARKKTEGFEEE